MAFRSDILAGKAVIVVSIQDNIDKQLRQIRTKLFNFSNVMSKFGQDLAILGGVGSAGAFFPIKDFVDFQDAMLFLQSKLKDTGVDMQKLESFIRDLGRTTSFTSQQVAEAAAVLAQAGLAEGVQPTLLPVLDLARGARVELDVAGRILANILTAFDLSFEQAGEVASKLTTAARLGTTDIVLLGEGLKESLTTFRQLGVPFESAIALITSLSNVSLRGTKAGTSLNTAFANLASKAEELQALGIIIDPKDFDDPIKIFEKLDAALSKLEPTEQVKNLQSLFNIRGARGFGGVLVQDLEKLRVILDKVRNSTDEAREASLLLDSRLGGVGRRALSAFQELRISIGQTTEGPLTEFGAKLQGLFVNLSKLAEENPKFVQTLLLIPPAALASGVAMIVFSNVLGKIGLLLGPIISMNNLLFASFKKLAGVNIGALKKVGQVGATPILSISQRIKKEEAAVVKAQQRLARALATGNAGNISQSISAVNKAETSRSFLTKSFSVKGIAESIVDIFRRAAALSSSRITNVLGDKIGDRAIAGAFRLGPSGISSIGDAYKSDLSLVEKNLKQQYVELFRNLKPATQLDLLDGVGPLVGPKQLLFDFQDTKIRPVNPRQLDLDFGASQLPLDFGDDDPTSFLTAGKGKRSSTGKFLPRNITQQVEDFVDVLSKQKAYKGLALNEVIDEAFTVFDLSDNAKNSIRMKIMSGLIETRDAVQQSFDFQDGALANPIQQMFDFTDSPTVPKGAAKQLDLDFGSGPKQLTFQFEDLADKTEDVAKGVRRVSIAQIRGEKYFAQTAKAAKSSGSIFTSLGKSLRMFARLTLSLSRDGLGKLGPVLRGVGSILRRAFNVNYLAGIVKGFKGFVTVLKGVFTILNGLRRLVFSGSGILLILEFLLIAGPKIPAIKTALDGLSNGFSRMFGVIGQTAGLVVNELGSFFGALTEFATGDQDAGLESMKNAFMNISEFISTGLTFAWQSFLEETQKGIQLLKTGFQGVIAIASGVGQVISSTAGTLFGGRSGEEFQYDDAGNDVLTSVVQGILAGIEATGITLIQIANAIRETFMFIKGIVIDIYRLIANSSLFGDDEAIKKVEEMDPTIRMKRELEEARAELSVMRGAASRPNSAGVDSPELKAQALLVKNLEGVLAMRGVKPEEDWVSIQTEIFQDAMKKIQDDFRNGIEKIVTNADEAEQKFKDAQEAAEFRGAGGLEDALQDFAMDDPNALMGPPEPPQPIVPPEDFSDLFGEGPVKKIVEPLVKLGTSISDIAKTVTGTGNQSRGQKLQLITSDADKVRQDQLDSLIKNTDPLKNSEGLVFQ